LRLFHWLCATDIPPVCDLRRCGWRMTPLAMETGCTGDCVALAHPALMDHRAWTLLRRVFPRRRHDRVLLLGIDDSGERGRLLGLGFGDVLGDAPTLDEVEARAERIAARMGMLPGSRQIGRLRLDLFARDGFIDDRPLGLHPREFALLWRLADTPGVAVAKQALIAEVWRLCHMPDTNSLAVHVFRLRSKLALAGLESLVQTVPSGGYRLGLVDEPARPAIPLITSDSRRDDLVVAEAATGVATGNYRHEL
jgi:DNA-binding response OmpR family regulator